MRFLPAHWNFGMRGAGLNKLFEFGQMFSACAECTCCNRISFGNFAAQPENSVHLGLLHGKMLSCLRFNTYMRLLFNIAWKYYHDESWTACMFFILNAKITL